jgi:hypothetical protein
LEIRLVTEDLDADVVARKAVIQGEQRILEDERKELTPKLCQFIGGGPGSKSTGGFADAITKFFEAFDYLERKEFDGGVVSISGIRHGSIGFPRIQNYEIKRVVHP